MASLQGSGGLGTSRIDIMFANLAAAQMVTSVEYRYDLVEVDHLPVQAKLDVKKYDDVIVEKRGLGRIDVSDMAGVTHEHKDNAYT